MQRTHAPAQRATQAVTVDSVSESCCTVSTPGCQCVCVGSCAVSPVFIVIRTKCLKKIEKKKKVM